VTTCGDEDATRQFPHGAGGFVARTVPADPLRTATVFGGTVKYPPPQRTIVAYQLDDGHEAVRDAVREFAQGEIRPVAREHDEEHRYPHDLVTEAARYDLVAPHIPEEYGGAGMDLLSTAVVTEELWRADPGIGLSIGARGFGSEMLIRYGDDWMREEWLPRIAAGESACASAISEPAHGSDPAGMETRAELDGDEWVLNGTKTWITNGTIADVMVVFAKTTPGDRHRGMSAFLVPTDVEGLETHEIDNKLGVHASDLAEVVLDDVRVPEANLIGSEDGAFYQLMDFFAVGRTNVAAQAVGVAQAAVEEAREYAKEREQGGQPIAEYQAIRHKIAEMATTTEAARALTYRAATAVEEGSKFEGAKLASMAKLFASERAVETADEAIQVFGGAGFVTDHPVERFYRDARITKIYEGTSEIQKNIIADQLLD
jgi:alkylation response protein AidB-like acyl-CoA dehydrogenase